MAIQFERRFRRSMNQELKERKQLKLRDFAIIAGLAAVAAELFELGGARYFIRLIFFGACVAFSYFVVALAFAQLRAKSQPFDHLLIFSEKGITVKDNLRDKINEYTWSDFERVRISSSTFEFKRRGSDRGEVYMLDRKKLSSEEDSFLGKIFVEL